MKKKTKNTKDISLLDILPRKLIILDFNANDKDDVLKQIAELFHEKKIVRNREGFYENLQARESLISTGCEGGVAFPYTISETEHDVIAGILISKEGIEFDAMDNKVTHIFLPITGKEERWKMDHHTYLYYLAHVTSLLKDKSFREELVNAKTVNEVVNLIKKYELVLRKRQNHGYI